MTGEAEKCIEGINLTAHNYAEALKILDERFGNKQLIISKHMEQLLKLERVRSSANFRELRSLYDRITVHLRSLSPFEIDSEHFGPMLISVVMEKLPNDIRLEMSRRMNKKEWKINDVVNILKDEVEAREGCEVSKFSKSDKRDYNEHQQNYSEKSFTTESLFKGSRNAKGKFTAKCSFCNQNHFSDQCTVISNVNTRNEIARNKKLCFRCLKSNHMIRNCANKNLHCFKCKSNRHHTALCGGSSNGNSKQNEDNALNYYEDKNDYSKQKQDDGQKHALMSADKSSVLLQTAEARMSDVKGLKTAEVRVIFDGGSQRTYITQRIADRLNLYPTGTQEMTINAFGDEKGKPMKVPEYDFCLTGPGDECFYLKGYADLIFVLL